MTGQAALSATELMVLRGGRVPHGNHRGHTLPEARPVLDGARTAGSWKDLGRLQGGGQRRAALLSRLLQPGGLSFSHFTPSEHPNASLAIWS